MIKHRINLLPWREEKHKIQCYQLYRKLIFIMIAQVVIWGMCLNSAQRDALRFNQQQIELQNIKDELASVLKETRFLQKNYITHKPRYVIANQYSLHIFDMLSRLPLEQGELNYFDFEPLSARQIKLTLQGKTLSQSEFEGLHRFLKEQSSITEVQLSQFEPQQNGELRFNLNLTAQPEGGLL